jgi:hypothetical protein
VILIAKEQQEQAQKILLNKGFRQQHARIFHYLITEGTLQYHCTVGLEDAEEDTMEVNISVMQRPLPGKKGIRLEDVKLVPVDETPASLQEVLSSLEDDLEELA